MGRRSQSGSSGRSTPHPAPYPGPCAPSLEPVAAAAAEAEADPADVRPMGLECFPPRPGGFRPLGFCMVVQLSGWKRARAGHVLPAIATRLQEEDKRDHIITSPRYQHCQHCEAQTPITPPLLHRETEARSSGSKSGPSVAVVLPGRVLICWTQRLRTFSLPTSWAQEARIRNKLV